MPIQSKTGKTRPSVPVGVRSHVMSTTVNRNAYRLQPIRHPKQTQSRVRNEHGRLLLSNIGHSIIDDDIYKKFGEIGKVDHVVMHLNRDNGLRTGTAEVWFQCGSSADKIKKKFNSFDAFNDGHLIRIEKPSILNQMKGFWKKVFDLQKLVEKTVDEEDDE